MAASYPNSAKSFTALNPGDIIQDTDPEAAYDEIAAMEQALLTNGLEHNLFPESTGDARTLGTTTKFWGQTYLAGITFKAATTLTISGGIVTNAQGSHAIDTESAAASDDLDTITAGTGISAESILILRAANVARVVTLKDGTGNLLLNGDYALNATDRTITLIYDGTNWREVARSVSASSDGTWTPSDASGAGLTIAATGVCAYTKTGKQVNVYGYITWPVTANGTNALLGGLPFTSGTMYGGGLPAWTDYGTPGFTVMVDASSTQLQFFAIGTTTRLTNANLSGKTMRLVLSYEAAS